MLNYGEELVYWYLRLNGFFLVDNFVVHGQHNRTTDSDLLAVRFPYVYEEIGGQQPDWDPRLFHLFSRDSIIGLIVQVKTSRETVRDEDVFRPRELSAALARFGFVPDPAQYLDPLMSRPKIIVDKCIEVGKTLFSDAARSRCEKCFVIDLKHAEEFIENRFQRYDYRKYADRMFFPSSLMQYIIWKNNG